MSAAGKGSRFTDYSELPKPFIEVDGRPMWQQAMLPFLYLNIPKVVFHESHEPYYEKPDFECRVIFLPHYTQGAAETAFYASLDCKRDESVVFVECDSQLIYSAKEWKPEGSSGSFVTRATSPNHSYVKVDKDDNILEVREKEVISEWANTGHYWWESVRIFQELFEDTQKIRDEYYMAPIYNDAVQQGYNCKIHRADAWKCWGTPADLVKTSRIDIIGQNGNDGLHYEDSSSN